MSLPVLFIDGQSWATNWSGWPALAMGIISKASVSSVLRHYLLNRTWNCTSTSRKTSDALQALVLLPQCLVPSQFFHWQRRRQIGERSFKILVFYLYLIHLFLVLLQQHARTINEYPGHLLKFGQFNITTWCAAAVVKEASDLMSGCRLESIGFLRHMKRIVNLETMYPTPIWSQADLTGRIWHRRCTWIISVPSTDCLEACTWHIRFKQLWTSAGDAPLQETGKPYLGWDKAPQARHPSIGTQGVQISSCESHRTWVRYLVEHHCRW